jgi:hypothetical protein
MLQHWTHCCAPQSLLHVITNCLGIKKNYNEISSFTVLRFHLLDDGSVHSKAFTYTGKRGNILTPCVGYESAIQENFMSVSVVEDDARRNSKSAVCRATVIFVFALQSGCRRSLWVANYHTPALNDFLGLSVFRWSQCIHHDTWKQAFRSRAALISATDSGRPVDRNKLRQYATNSCNTAVYGTVFSRLKWLFMVCVFLRNNGDLVTQFIPYNIN